MAALGPMISRHLKMEPVPQTLIIHLGTNDLFDTPVREIRGRMEEGLRSIRNLLPSTRIIWSDILLRLFYYGEIRPGVGKKNVCALNKFAHRLCKQMGNASAITNSHIINPFHHSLYWRDGLHLSTSGNQAFCENLYGGLAFFAQNPEALLFPVVNKL